LRIHVMEGMPKEYQIIIGCDLLGKVGAQVENKEGIWAIRIGNMKYKCRGATKDIEARVGAIQRVDDWRQKIKAEYEDIFFKEGDKLGVTGRAR
ncbi:hypothetical protein ACUWCL_28475, partial [Klebsiella pneumoniae]|uniref:hypothetical protein n=1 Tax=Klebsiella pneumoniae TaxID=573 RepID=UPI0040555E36